MELDERGKFAKGNSGRKKGAVNRLTNNARILFLQTLENQVPNIEQAFDDVRAKNPKEYLDLFAKYAQYFVPKKTDLTSDNEKISTTIINLGTGSINETTTEAK